jgi:hypothetical protein
MGIIIHTSYHPFLPGCQLFIRAVLLPIGGEGGGEAMHHCPKVMHHVQRAYRKVEMKSFYVQRTNKRMKCPMKKMMVVTNGFKKKFMRENNNQLTDFMLWRPPSMFFESPCA